MAHECIIKSLHDAQAECSCGGWSFSFTGPMSREAINREHTRHAVTALEKELRDTWTAKGVPKEKQEAMLREVEEKARPGAWVGPFQMPKE